LPGLRFSPEFHCGCGPAVDSAAGEGERDSDNESSVNPVPRQASCGLSSRKHIDRFVQRALIEFATTKGLLDPGEDCIVDVSNRVRPLWQTVIPFQ
jgi:hypothetical protein